MALVTGEDVPTGESTVARFFEAEITRNDVNLELLTKFQNILHFWQKRWLATFNGLHQNE